MEAIRTFEEFCRSCIEFRPGFDPLAFGRIISGYEWLSGVSEYGVARSAGASVNQLRRWKKGTNLPPVVQQRQFVARLLAGLRQKITDASKQT